MKHIHTVQIANQREAHVRDLPVLDITVKSGDVTFAPTWALVMGYKNGEISDDEYRHQYLELMRLSMRDNSERWSEVLTGDQVVLACYCKPYTFCHRLILAELLKNLWYSAGDEVIDEGEIAP